MKGLRSLLAAVLAAVLVLQTPGPGAFAALAEPTGPNAGKPIIPILGPVPAPLAIDPASPVNGPQTPPAPPLDSREAPLPETLSKEKPVTPATTPQTTPGVTLQSLFATYEQRQAEIAAALAHPSSPEEARGAAAPLFVGKESKPDPVDLTAPVPETPTKANLPKTSDGQANLRSPEWWSRIQSLPSSFKWGFTPAWTINGMSQEVQAVALPLFSAALFGVETTILMTGVGYLMRIVGAWAGSSLMARFNPKWVNVAALALLVAAGMPIPIAAAWHASKAVMLGIFYANAVIQGLVYGVNRGVGENLLARLLIGKDKPQDLELGLNVAYQCVEICCLIMSYKVAVPLLHAVGGNMMMVLSSIGIGIASVFYAFLKFREPWATPAPNGTASPGTDEPASKLGIQDYMPYAFFRFMHFMVYGVLATVWALTVFSADSAAGTMIGLYDGGSWLLSLLASIALLPDKKLGRRGWTVIGGVSAIAFVWSSLLNIPILTFALGGVLGGAITINSNKWMAYYSENLSQNKYRNLSKLMMTASILAMLPIFIAVSLARISPTVAAVLSMHNILLGANIYITLAAAIMIALQLRSTKA